MGTTVHTIKTDG